MTATLASPALDHIIERPRLISLLEEAGARVALLVAPAGYGKTTLARQWSARQTGPVAWHRTTRASGDVAALSVSLDDVLAAAADTPRRDPKRIRSIAAVNASPAPLARALVSTYAHLTRDVLLVLDEWEAAGTEEADELMAAIVDDLDIRILVTSRSRPPWCTSRLAVYGEALEIGLEQLAMTEPEGLDVLATNRHVKDKETILERARGWPAVLGLAAMSTRTKMPLDAISRTLHDFLAEELLAATPPSVEQGVLLLVAAAISNSSTAELVLGNQTHALMGEAAARGLVIPAARGELSVHPLIREALTMRLAHGEGISRADLAAPLRPLITAERWDEVLVAAETLCDRRFVTEALHAGIDHVLAHRGASTLRRWTTAAKRARVAPEMVAYLESESAFRGGEYDKSLGMAATAARRLTGDLAARAHLVAALAAHLGDCAKLGDPHIADGMRLAEHPHTRRAAHWLRFVRALEEEASDAAEALGAFEAECQGDAETTVRVALGRLHLGLLLGDLPHELDTAAAAAHLLEAEITPLVRTSFLNMYSNALATAARYREALSSADEEAQLAEEYEFDFVKGPALINRARALVGLRRFALARRALAHLGRAAEADPKPYLRAHHAIQTAGLYLSMGDPSRAYAALAIDPGDTGAPFRAEYFAIRALAQTFNDDEAARASADVAVSLSYSNEIRALTSMTHAVSAVNRSDQLRAAEELRGVLATGTLDALVLGLRSSLRLGELMAADQELRPILSRLLHATNDSALARRLGVAVPRSRVRSQALSPRELEIHGLIAQGMTNLEIAQLLFIAESTTKVHVRHIFEKLGVRSRAEAASVWQDTANEE